MIGLFLLFCLLAVLGFVYVWIANVVARTDVEVKTGIIILFVAGLAGWGIRAALSGAGGVTFEVAGSGVHFLALVLLTRYLAAIEWKQALIVAAIFTGLMFVAGLALAAMTGG